MISELTDTEILDFLMTSDFEEEYNPEELKYLLFKWRNFYRILHGRNERTIENFESELKVLKDQLNTEMFKYNELLVKLADTENSIHQMKQRKLSWKERLSGKIIPIKDENK